MIHNKLKEQIKLYIKVNDYLTDKRMPTDEETERIIMENYNNECAIEVIDNDFITYDINDDCVFIKDIVAFGHGLSLINLVINKAKELCLPILAYVHFSNFEIINVLLKRFKFKIVKISLIKKI